MYNSIWISNVACPTKSMESAPQPSLFAGMFFLKLAGHVTKLSKTSNWLIIFVLLSAINVIGWRVYSCLVNSFGCICFEADHKSELSLCHKQGNPLEGRILRCQDMYFMSNFNFYIAKTPCQYDKKEIFMQLGFVSGPSFFRFRN